MKWTAGRCNNQSIVLQTDGRRKGRFRYMSIFSKVTPLRLFIWTANTETWKNSKKKKERKTVSTSLRRLTVTSCTYWWQNTPSGTRKWLFQNAKNSVSSFTRSDFLYKISVSMEMPVGRLVVNHLQGQPHTNGVCAYIIHTWLEWEVELNRWSSGKRLLMNVGRALWNCRSCCEALESPLCMNCAILKKFTFPSVNGWNDWVGKGGLGKIVELIVPHIQMRFTC